MLAAMIDLCKLIWWAFAGLFRSRAPLEAEILVLRHQLNVLRRKSPGRLAFSSIDRLVFAGSIRGDCLDHVDVKNGMDLNFKFDQLLTDLIDEYVHEFRPTLLRGSNSNLLFPGENGEPTNGLQFSKQITERIQKTVGLRITVHQFRHAAAAIYLKHHPGKYERVQLMLGHRSIRTTIKFYCGLETIAATEEFGKLIREHIEFDDELDEVFRLSAAQDFCNKTCCLPIDQRKR